MTEKNAIACPDQLDDHRADGDDMQRMKGVEGSVYQPQQLDSAILLNVKRERDDEQDSQEEGSSVQTESSKGSNAKRLKTGKGDLIAEKKKSCENSWELMYQRLVAFKEQHGHCLVPKRYNDDPKLGCWVETQRVQYRRLDRKVCPRSGKESITPNKRLCLERLTKLEEIGFCWSAKTLKKVKSPLSAVPAPHPPKKIEGVTAKASTRNRSKEETWEEYFNKLKAYKDKHGDVLVPRKYESDPKLASWVETMRSLWNRDFKWQEVKAKSKGSESISPALPGAYAEHQLTVPPDEILTDHTSKPTGIDQQETLLEAEADGGTQPTAAPVGVLMDSTISCFPAKRLTQELKERLDGLGFVWSLRHKRIADHWQHMFDQLVEYKAAHGDCLVPSRYEPNMKLGKFVEGIRYEYTKMQRATLSEDTKSNTDETKSQSDGLDEAALVPVDEAGTVGPAAGVKTRQSNSRLTQDRIRQLESIGFEWKVKHKMKRYYDKQWESMLSRLMAYKAKYGHCNVPKRYKEDPKLGTWTHTQRIQYRKFLAGTAKKGGDAAEFVASGEIRSEEEISFRLTEDRRKRLEEVGFLWSSKESGKTATTAAAPKVARNSYDKQWDAMFAKLLEFKEKYGHCLVPKRYKEDKQLGTWVDTNRVQYKKLQKKLAEQGPSTQAVQISGAQGETDSSILQKPIVGRLTSERIRRLEEIGFTWSLRDDWQKHYNELKDFKAETGHCNVPARYAANRRLGIWVSAQRQQYKYLKAPVDPKKPKRSSPLTQERINLLNEVGFTWTVRSRDSSGEAWTTRYDALKRYKEEFGDCFVPISYPPNFELGVFVQQQRAQYKLYMEAKSQGTDPSLVSEMTEERIAQLEALNFVWDTVKDSEEAHLLAAGAMIAKFREQCGSSHSVDSSNQDDRASTSSVDPLDQDDPALQEALQRSEMI